MSPEVAAQAFDAFFTTREITLREANGILAEAGLRRRATDGRLYVWAQNGKFYAVSPEGKLLYSYDGDAAAQGIALGAGGLVYLISSGGLVALQD